MPCYELALILRLTDRATKVQIIKDTVTGLLKNGHNVRKIQNVGDRHLPFAMKSYEHGTQNKGSYILLDVDFKETDINLVKEYFKKNSDILRMSYHLHSEVYGPETECFGNDTIDYLQKVEELKKMSKSETVAKRNLRSEAPFQY